MQRSCMLAEEVNVVQRSEAILLGRFRTQLEIVSVLRYKRSNLCFCQAAESQESDLKLDKSTHHDTYSYYDNLLLYVR